MSGRALAVAVAVAVGVVVRLVAVDRLPGINGDEAWYAVNVHELLNGGTPFLQTPSGNFVNPVHSFPLLLISLVAEPSFVVLRAPEVCWGILTFVLAYPLLAGPLGGRAAAVATALLAVAPTTVIYSRLGWDPSGAPLMSLLAIASALRDRPILALVFAGIAYLVHPTTVFQVPFVATAWMPHVRARYARAPPLGRRRQRIAGTALLVVGFVGVVLVVFSLGRMGRLPSIEMVVARMVSVHAWLESALAVVRLLSGVTAATYTAGPLDSRLASIADLVAISALMLSLTAPAWNPAIGRRFMPWLVAGLGASFATMHLVAGPVALEPGFERYAMGLIVPIIITVATGLSGASDATAPRASSGLKSAAAVVAGLLVAWQMLVLTVGYFVPLMSRGGDAHLTFRTGLVEPKAAAYEFVRRQVAGASVVTVFADDWWLYWPTRYLAIPERGRIFVEMLGTTPPVYPSGVDPPRHPDPERTFAVVFADGTAWHQLRQAKPVFTAFDPIGRAIVHVVELPPGARPPFAVSSNR